MTRNSSFPIETQYYSKSFFCYTFANHELSFPHIRLFFELSYYLHLLK